MVIVAHRGVFLEDLGLVWRLDILFDRHQAFLAGLLQDVVEHGHQLHVAGLGVLGPLERHGQCGQGGLDDLGLVVHHKGAQRATQNGDDLEGQGLEDHADIPAVHDVHTEDAAQADDVTDDDEHALDVLGGNRSKNGSACSRTAVAGLPKVTANVSDC